MALLDMRETAEDIQDLEQVVRQWLDKNGMKDDYRSGGHKIYTQEQWRDKGETMGSDARLTIISEGEMMSLWDRDPCCDLEPLLSLREAVMAVGYYPELGFHWSMHFCWQDI